MSDDRLIEIIECCLSVKSSKVTPRGVLKELIIALLEEKSKSAQKVYKRIRVGSKIREVFVWPMKGFY